MKKVFIAITLIGVLSACSNPQKEKEKAIADAQAVQAAKLAVIDSLRLDSLDKAKLAEAEAEKSAALVKQKVKSKTSNGSGGSNTGYSGSSTADAKKKGWSDAAKGATIGGVAGAVGGAIIDKKSGRGAVIGGVVGAGTGYVIGREKDKKTGRVVPKKTNNN